MTRTIVYRPSFRYSRPRLPNIYFVYIYIQSVHLFQLKNYTLNIGVDICLFLIVCLSSSYADHIYRRIEPFRYHRKFGHFPYRMYPLRDDKEKVTFEKFNVEIIPLLNGLRPKTCGHPFKFWSPLTSLNFNWN